MSKKKKRQKKKGKHETLEKIMFATTVLEFISIVLHLVEQITD